VACAVPPPTLSDPHCDIAWAMSIWPTMSSKSQVGTVLGANLKWSSKLNSIRSV
jgi:hypothetical protein